MHCGRVWEGRSTAASQLFTRIWVPYAFHFLQSASIQTLQGINSIYLLVVFCLSLQAHTPLTSAHTHRYAFPHFSLKVFSLLRLFREDKAAHWRKEKSQWWMVCTSATQCSTINLLLINVCHWPPTILTATHTHTHISAPTSSWLSSATDANLLPKVFQNSKNCFVGVSQIISVIVTDTYDQD